MTKYLPEFVLSLDPDGVVQDYFGADLVLSSVATYPISGSEVSWGHSFRGMSEDELRENIVFLPSVLSVFADRRTVAALNHATEGYFPVIVYPDFASHVEDHGYRIADIGSKLHSILRYTYGGHIHNVSGADFDTLKYLKNHNNLQYPGISEWISTLNGIYRVGSFSMNAIGALYYCTVRTTSPLDIK